METQMCICFLVWGFKIVSISNNNKNINSRCYSKSVDNNTFLRKTNAPVPLSKKENTD